MASLSWSSPSPLIELLDVSDIESGLQFTVKSIRKSCPCPSCHHLSSRPHSQYTRVVQDLPVAGQPVSLLLILENGFVTLPPVLLRCLPNVMNGFLLMAAGHFGLSAYSDKLLFLRVASLRRKWRSLSISQPVMIHC
ncbi:hypothetical protein GEPA3_0555 [Geobacillus sp. PA-3]|nr:hypothetical protein GEPA3_0555 [Geobacillus sp. PA-3]